MEIISFTLVIISCVTHALWNFLIKRSTDKNIFVGLSKISEIVIFFIPFAYIIGRSQFDLKYWYFIIIAALFVFLNYFLLAQSYKRIDLTIAYPVSRSNTLFLPLVAFLLIGETIDHTGWISITLIIIGVFLMYFDDFRIRRISIFKNTGILFALSAAFTVACYTVWDKMAIKNIQPFVYFYSYTFLTGLFYFFMLHFKYEKSKIAMEWSKNKIPIISVAVLNTFTYILVLIALSVSKAIYVGALRQLSLVFALFLGWKFLHEKLSYTRLAGLALLVLGSTLTLFSH